MRNSKSDVRCLAPKISLYVYESIELALYPSSDIDRNFEELSKFSCDDRESKEESCTVKLFKGIVKLKKTMKETAIAFHVC